jgi:hypothetical protein
MGTKSFVFFIIIATALLSFRSSAQDGTWLHRGATDTTQITCINDSLSSFRFAPGSMGMMFPDSVFCRAEVMCLDSLPFHGDSSFVGWVRFQMGTDSMHFNFMHADSGHMGHHSMGFMLGVQCVLHWDSLFCDSTFMGWRLRGIRQWGDTGWVSVPGASVSGSFVTFTTTDLSAAYAFVGEPAQPTAVDTPPSLPRRYRLEQNYPNPFNPSTNIGFRIADFGLVRLVVYDLLGRQVAVLVNERKPAGSYEVTFDAAGLSSGIYIYRLTAGQYVESRKMVVLK